MKVYAFILIFLTSWFSPMTWAESGVAVSAEYSGYPSVEDNLRLMDKDRNGLVTASEVRAHLEIKHGKGYEKAILDKIQSSEAGASCGTPFAQSLY